MPTWQVETDDGWQDYPPEAQETIRAAAVAGRATCELSTNGGHYRLDLHAMRQLNTDTNRERGMRVSGPLAPDAHMPKLNFKRLMAEFKHVEVAIQSGRDPSILRCNPVEDSLMEWEVDLSFAPESSLQVSLMNLAAIMCDPSLARATLRFRFPMEYPMSPPEVWLRRPRMKHQSGPVTFGGKICTLMLASDGWLPGSPMVTVIADVRQSFIDAGLEAETAVSVRKSYPERHAQLARLQTELFPTANGFCKDLTVMSPGAATAFLGNLSRLEATDKIGLPFECAAEIYGRVERGGELELPMVFEVKTQLGRKTHCAIFEFMEGLPASHALLPKWVMEDLCVEERESIRVRGVGLDLITFVKIQPRSVDFYHAVRDSDRDVNQLLTEALSRFSALTEDTSVPIDISGRAFDVQVVELRPRGAVRIIDADVQHHFEFQVDFEPAPDLEDEGATKAHQERLLATFRLRREQSDASRRSVALRRAEARRARFEQVRDRALAAAGTDLGTEGDIEVAMRLPNGSQLKGKFREGAPMWALVALALSSEWAEATTPWGLHLMQSFPKKLLGEGDAVSRDMHRSAVSVQEERAPDNDAELFAHAECLSPKAHAGAVSADPEPAAPPPLPARDESALQARTQRAFELQRFIRAGVDPEEAAARLEAGEVLPQGAVRAAPRPPVAGVGVATSPPMLQRTLSQAEQRERKIQDVMNFTGAAHAIAEEALEHTEWSTDLAVNLVLDGM